MKIAQIAPLMESVPPKFYGGTERIVSYLTEELVRQGHEVTLFASGDSRTSAELVACCDAALRLSPKGRDPVPCHVSMLEQVRRWAEAFDVLHFHVDVLHFPIIREFSRRTVTTLHGRLDLPDLARLYAMFDDIPLVSISDDQRRPMPPVNWLGTVYHGLPPGILPFREKASSYLAFLGRISPEKGPLAAIEIAARARMPLKIAAKIDSVDRSFWRESVEPQVLRNSNVEFIGEINERQKAEFLGNAAALLFPIDWPEPFGLVTIEAMACGTPVVAFNRGAVPEVIDDGVSGFIVKNIAEAVKAVHRVGDLDRARVRRTFEKRFTAERMCADYMAIYRSLTGDKQRSFRRSSYAGNIAGQATEPAA
ncbi:glycosyl transferase (plasmid) [Mesorhizobium sp. 131-3-5]|jgi:glycosyltransferase involved in cell wall biosynthesis|uniref:glycosyltransferase family 4 protein n=1 Tax=unclassified Mesorhizobium TaxID=325217 RepID=UPI00035EF5CD|nr:MULTISPECIES: glycosyltransferase family 4 protein [Mesorhizobium]ANN62201.1 glycosyl transferase [Mesorhizobium loti NZP2037]BCH05568.1 glycosyl transferase [Mesorhizobium sp. 131-2-5]BCH13054.1 glycosyl transferase [Mesorhizobium sp. 131-3-5]